MMSLLKQMTTRRPTPEGPLIILSLPQNVVFSLTNLSHTTIEAYVYRAQPGLPQCSVSVLSTSALLQAAPNDACDDRR